MKKSDYVKLTEETMHILEKEGYWLGGKRISITNSKLETKYIANEERESKATLGVVERPGTYCVTDETTLEAIFKQSSKHIGVLNFASARRPGGAFMLGAAAQEETLVRASNLYESLKQCPDYYHINRHWEDTTYDDHMIVSKNVTFFRNSMHELVEEPIQVETVISASPVNVSTLDRRYQSWQVSYIMKNRIKMILDQFVEEKSKVLILGAFGCGAYKNNPYEVAKAFYDVLVKKGYRHYFETVIFAIPITQKEHNHAIFKSEMHIENQEQEIVLPQRYVQ